MAHRWYPTYPNDEEGCVPIVSIIHQVPKPFLGRVWKADEYEQVVYNFIANKGLEVEGGAKSLLMWG